MAFKDLISAYGKQIEVQITIDDTYTAEDVVSVNPHYDGALYTAVMKCLDIEFDGERTFDGGNISAFNFGVRTSDTDDYTYISFGEYIIKDSKFDVDTNATKLECYDKMLLSMVPYDLALDYSEGVTVLAFLQAICDRFGWTLATTEFANSAVVIEEEKYDATYTFRDVLTEIAQVAGGMIAFKPDGNLYVIYPEESGEIIDDSNLKSLTIGEKYGPVNSIVLARTPQEDNIYLRDDDSISANGLCEVKIENNQIMDSHRDDFITALFERINGTSYYEYELESYGIGYLNLGDYFTLQTDRGAEYKALFLQDDLQITQGVVETSAVDFPAASETDYTAASKTDKALNRTILRVDKQDQTIKSLVSTTTNLQNSIDAMNGTVEQLTQTVSQTVTSTEVKTLISETLSDGVNSITTETGYTFNKDGLTVSKSDSPMSTTIDEDGMIVRSDVGKVLTANHDGVNAMNLTARQYLTIGTHSRFEDYVSDKDEHRTGCFFVEMDYSSGTRWNNLLGSVWNDYSAYTWNELSEME